MNNLPEGNHRRKWHALTAVGVGVFPATVDGSIFNVSLPTLVRSLDTEFAVTVGGSGISSDHYHHHAWHRPIGRYYW